MPTHEKRLCSTVGDVEENDSVLCRILGNERDKIITVRGYHRYCGWFSLLGKAISAVEVISKVLLISFQITDILHSTDGIALRY